LLPDAIRSRLALDVLPEMPVRARSSDEERYLFAQLFSASRCIEVSWHLASQGSVGSRSPFVADLLRSDAPNPVAPQVWSTVRADLGPRPAWEHAVLVAGNAPRTKLAGPLESALVFGGLVRDDRAATELARSRIDILHHTDPERRDDRVNPWFGFVGPIDSGSENGLSVTLIEGTAQCPWSSFVTHRLRVAPMPDPQLGLPDPRGRLVGDVVHRVLEDIVLSAAGEPRENVMDEIGSRSPRSIPWPTAARLDTILERAAREVADDAGLGPLGMAVLLAARARPFLEVARRFEWGETGSLGSVLATEVKGFIEIEGADEVLRFRADRVDRHGDSLCLVDYKTSGPVSCAQGDETRRKHLLNQVRTGRRLQAAAYALVSADGSARGRYLWLRPNIGGADETCRNGEIRGDDEDFSSALRDAVVAVSGARNLGAMFPRVEEPGSDRKPDQCRYCPVAEVCRRDDSSFRRRLVEWMEAGDPGSSPSEDAARRLWFLGVLEGDAP
jgi:hypothetical protein